MLNVFISYRRSGPAGEAGRIKDRLGVEYGPERIFLDVESVAPGVNFVATLDAEIRNADVMLVVIGPGWATEADEDGVRRLDRTNDWVRVEVETALQEGITIVPVLVKGADMPAAEDLPPTMAPVVHLQAVEVSHARFHPDMNGLIRAITNRREAAQEEARREAEAEAIRQAETRAAQRAASSKRTLVICLDGLSNADYSVKSNLRKMSIAVLPTDPTNDRPQLVYYPVSTPHVETAYLESFGRQFWPNITGALTFLSQNYTEGDSVYLFGFGVGGAEATTLASLLDWLGGVPTRLQTTRVLHIVRAYAARRPMEGSVDTHKASIRMLGVWEAMWLPFRSATKHGLTDSPPECVEHVRHAIAIDERRNQFRAHVWQRPAPQQTLEQRWFPGSHSDVGGGYRHAGVANTSFRWMASEASGLGLALDSDYTRHFMPYPQAPIHDSYAFASKVYDLMTFRGSGRRAGPTAHPDDSNCTVDPSVLQRMVSDPEDHIDLEPYRPESIVRFLARQPDLDEFLRSLGPGLEEAVLSPDLHAAILTARAKYLRGDPTG